MLPQLNSKKEVDEAIKTVAEKVLVLRFGRDEDHVCLQLDNVVSRHLLFIYLQSRNLSGVHRKTSADPKMKIICFLAEFCKN